MTKINYPFEEMKFQVDSMKLAKKVMFDTNASSLQSIAAIMDANAIDRAVLTNSLKALVEPFEMFRREYSTGAISQISKTLSIYTQPSKVISDVIKQNALSLSSIYECLPTKIGISNIVAELADQLRICNFDTLIPKLDVNVNILSLMRDYIGQINMTPELLTKYADNIETVNSTNIPDIGVSIHDMERALYNENFSDEEIDIDSLEREYKYHLKFIDINNGLDQIFQHCHEAYYLADAMLSYESKQQLYSRMSTLIPDLIHEGSIFVVIGIISFIAAYAFRDNEIMLKFIRAIKSLNDDL